MSNRMRTGIVTIPLHYGKCPRWLFERMKRLARGIILAIREEFGPEEILKRLADPVWFQSLGCTIGFDWHSSGLTTTTLGALKEGLGGIEKEVDIFICGGKGQSSLRTPQQIREHGEKLRFSEEKVKELVQASKMSAKVDSSLLQDGYQLYHHNFIFSNRGEWTVIQQGMQEENSTARRYHWLSFNLTPLDPIRNKFLTGLNSKHLTGFTEEPHAGIISDPTKKPVLNLTAKESRQNKENSLKLVREEPRTFLKDIESLTNSPALKKSFQNHQVLPSAYTTIEKTSQLTLMELRNIDFYWHPVLKEKFNLKRLKKTIFFAHSQAPQDFEQFLSLEGIGPRTVRTLSLVSELIYGAKPSFEDPARYSFCVGGKDGVPEPINRTRYDKILELMERGIKKSKIPREQKVEAQRRLANFF